MCSIPEEGIINEFLQERNGFESILHRKSIQKIPCGLFAYFGLYEHIIVNKNALTLDDYNDYYMSAILASEAYYKINMQSIQMENLFCLPFAFIGLDEHRFKYSKLIFTAFLKYYKRFSGRTDFSEQYGARIWLAYIMLFYGGIILQELKMFKKSQNLNIKPNIMRTMKEWTLDDIISIGTDFFLDTTDSFSNFIKTLISPNAPDKIIRNPAAIFLVIGLIKSLSTNEIPTANRDLGVAIMMQKDLYLRVVGLLQLCSNCYVKAQYFIGLKILRFIYKICKGYCCPTFVNETYSNKRSQFKNRIKGLVCSNCSTKMHKLRSCIGCMEVQYCSNKCQKYHWNKTHRNKCHRFWDGDFHFYKKLKSYMLQRL
eukprot:322942_1